MQDLECGIWNAGFGIQDLGHRIWDTGFGSQDLRHKIWDTIFGTQDLGHRISDTRSEAYASRPWRIGIGSTSWELPGIRTHRHEFQKKTQSNRNAHTHTHMAHIQPRSFCVFLPRSRMGERTNDSWSQWKENLHTYVRTYVRSHVLSLCYGVTKIVSTRVAPINNDLSPFSDCCSPADIVAIHALH